MYKKLQRNIVFLLMLFIIPLTIGRVDCAWTYYEGTISSSSVELGNIGFNGFNFFPDDDKGQSNEKGQDTIIGNNDSAANNDNSLSNPNSMVNIIGLNKDKLNLVNRDFIIGEDYTINGTNYKQELGLTDNINFVIHRITMEDLDIQYYSLYTTDVNMNNMKKGDIVYPIYKTDMVWTRINGSEGKWETGKLSIGYAPITRVKTTGKIFNNATVNYFDHTQFVEGYYGTSINEALTISLNETSIASSNGEPVFYKTNSLSPGTYSIDVLSNNSDALLTRVDSKGAENGVSDNKSIKVKLTRKGVIYFKVLGNNTKIKFTKLK